MNFKTMILLIFFIFNSNTQFWKCLKKKNVKTELSENAYQKTLNNIQVLLNSTTKSLPRFIH
jgi:hypothetical protein